MAYPSIEQYQEALQHPATAFIDSLLAKGKIRSSGLGTPLVVSGGFALTYGVEVAAKKYAVRCFHREAKGLENRYAAISKKIQTLSSDYFVEFEYQGKGVRIGAQSWPIVKMAWATGETLGEFVEKNYTDKVKLSNLINSLLQLSKYLEVNGIAHGDIQDGNLMVGDSGKRLQLIDYDGMFVPELSSLGSSELGQRDYQHPRRDSSIYDAKLDRFSFIAINLALRALIEKQDIWRLSQSGAGVIVFKANDYAAPTNSKVLNEIKIIPGLKVAADNFVAICSASYSEVPVLEDFLSGSKIPKLVVSSSQGQSSEAKNATIQYISQYPVINASDYDGFQKNVGQMVELVGRIQNVKSGTNKYGKPYIFVNFSDPRRSGVKINIWNNAIESGGVLPAESWIGKWVTIKGLVEPPFTSPIVNASHIAITANALSQISRLTEDEAKYRLGEIKVEGGESTGGSNSDLLKTLMGVNQNTKNNVSLTPPSSISSPPASNTPTAMTIAMQNAGSKKTPNQLALEAMRNAGSKTTPLPSTPRVVTSSANTTRTSTQNVPKPSSNVSWGTYLFWGVVVLLIIKSCAK